MNVTEQSGRVRRLSGGQLAEAQQNLRRCFELNRIGRRLAMTGFKYDHPDATDHELSIMFQDLLEQRREGKWL